MKTTVVRYQAKPERADENQQLIEAVFAELDEREPEGFTYKVFRLDDGVSFIHVVIEHDVDEPESLQAVPAFQAFVADIADRCDIPRWRPEQPSSAATADLRGPCSRPDQSARSCQELDGGRRTNARIGRRLSGRARETPRWSHHRARVARKRRRR